MRQQQRHLGRHLLTLSSVIHMPGWLLQITCLSGTDPMNLEVLAVCVIFFHEDVVSFDRRLCTIRKKL